MRIKARIKESVKVSCSCLQLLLDRQGLFWGIHAWRKIIGQYHAESDTIFERSELFKRLGLLKARGWPFHKLMQKIALKTIDAQVAIMLSVRSCISHEWQRRSRKVKAIAIDVEDDLHNVGVSNKG